MQKIIKKLKVVTPRAAKDDTDTFSIRALIESIAHFNELCRRKGLKRNQALVRLLHFAIWKEWIPDYVANPQLPGYVPPKEMEDPPATPFLD